MTTPPRQFYVFILFFAIASSGPGQAGGEDPSKQLIDALGPDHARKMAEGLKLFKSEAREILTSNCLPCHGGERTRSKYNLSTRAGLIKGGSEGQAVVIGKHSESVLYKMAAHQLKPHMPHKRPKLPEDKINTIARWIDLGAPYDRPLSAGDEGTDAGLLTVTDEHRKWWAFQPLKPGAPSRQEKDTWSAGDIDRFILSRLREKNLAPNPAASARDLVRRIYFDIIGLPPPPEVIDAFTADPSPKAWSGLIDELLASPHYGERWGRHWLDLARFAESHGFEQDYDRNHAYHYRDFVIKALNSDMPYDQFVRWQLAGDELAPDDSLAMMATGFLGAGVFPTQLTEKEFESSRYDELDDMVNTMGTAMLGLTIGCARCHDHKFDPIPTRDYYRLVSSFGTTIRSEIDLPMDTTEHRKALATWSSARKNALEAREAYARGELKKTFEAWLRNGTKEAPPKAPWEVLDLSRIESRGGATLEKLPDGSVLATGTNPDPDRYLLGAGFSTQGIRALRIEALTHSSMPRNGPGRASNGNFGLTDLKISIRPLKTLDVKLTPVKIASARATHQQNEGNLSVKAALDGNASKTGWAVDSGGIGHDQAAVFSFDRPIGFPGGTWIEITIQCGANTRHNLGRPRLSITSTDAPVAVGGGLPQPLSEGFALLKNGKPEDLPGAAREALFSWFSGKDKRWLALNEAVEKQNGKEPKAAKTVKVQVTSEGFKPTKHHADGRGFPHFYKETYFLSRGDPAQKKGVASQGFLTVLMDKGKTEKDWQEAPPKGWRTSYRRRSLANWLTDPENGAGTLLARVIVNRLWQHHFGRGLVSTPNDFGVQGEKPSHPALLDWLAGELIRGGWRLKPIHKLILISGAYRQSAAYDEARAARDPLNRFLWRRSPTRLEAEIIRDSVLKVSGLLDTTMFGKGTLNEGMTRRSIYFMIKRSKVIPSMQLFDSPEPLVSQGSRPDTIIAPQALLFMNSPHIRRSATRLMEKLQDATGANEPAGGIAQGYRLALGREPTATERGAAVAFFSRQESSYAKAGRDSREARRLALIDFCQVLFGLNEFIYIK